MLSTEIYIVNLWNLLSFQSAWTIWYHKNTEQVYIRTSHSNSTKTLRYGNRWVANKFRCYLFYHRPALLNINWLWEFYESRNNSTKSRHLIVQYNSHIQINNRLSEHCAQDNVAYCYTTVFYILHKRFISFQNIARIYNSATFHKINYLVWTNCYSNIFSNVYSIERKLT